jgi:hypothetical protein
MSVKSSSGSDLFLNLILIFPIPLRHRLDSSSNGRRNFWKSACDNSHQEVRFIVLLEIAPWCLIGNPHCTLGTKALYGYLAKVFQFHVNVHVDVLLLFLTLCLCTFHVCAMSLSVSLSMSSPLSLSMSVSSKIWRYECSSPTWQLYCLFQRIIQGGAYI